LQRRVARHCHLAAGPTRSAFIVLVLVLVLSAAVLVLVLDFLQPAVEAGFCTQP
jgi:hypothetical protein